MSLADWYLLAAPWLRRPARDPQTTSAAIPFLRARVTALAKEKS